MTIAPTPTATSAAKPAIGFQTDSLAVGVLFAISITLIQRLVGFARGILFCGLLPEEQLGQWSMVFSFLMMLPPLAALGLPGTFGRYAEHYLQRGQLKSYLFRMIGITSIVSLALAGAMLVQPAFFSWLIFRDASQLGLVRMIAAVFLSVCAFNVLTSLLEALRQVRLVSLMRFVSGVGFTLIAISLLLAYRQHTSVVVVGFGLSCLLGCIPGIWFLVHRRSIIHASNDPLSQRTMWKRVAPFAAWLWMTNMLTHAYESVDRYMLLHLWSSDFELSQSAVGQYHAGRVVPLLLVNIAVVLSGILMPYLSSAWERKEYEQVKSQVRAALKAIGFLFTAGGAFVLAFSPLLFQGILQGRYDDGLSVLPLTLVYCTWYSLAVCGHDYLWCAERGRAATLAMGVGLVVNVAMNAALIPRFGLQGAVLATTLANGFGLVLLYAVNAYHGMKSDLGIWWVTALPLALLLGPIPAIIIVAFTFVAAVQYDWIFNATEKRDLAAAFDKIRQKFRRTSTPQ